MSHPISSLLQLYIVVILLRVVLSWFPIQPDSVFATVYRFVYVVTEPVLGVSAVMLGLFTAEFATWRFVA